ISHLEGLQRDKPDGLLHLARAHGALKTRDYPAFLTCLEKAERATGIEAGLVVATLVKGAQQAHREVNLPPDGRKAVLDKLLAILKASPSLDKDEDLAGVYCALLLPFVEKRIPELARRQDFEELRPYCDQAAATGRAPATVIACLAECLLRRADSDLN